MEAALNRENKFVDFLLEKRFRIHRHLFIWIYLLFTEILCHHATNIYEGNLDEYRLIAKICLFITMVYLNMYVLVPRFIYRERYFSYLVALTVIIIASLVLFELVFNLLFNHYTLPNQHAPTILESLDVVNMVAVGVLSTTSIKLLQKWKRDTSRIYELENNALQVELRELKNQINPHFLFNMLNNVNVLTIKDPNKASVIVLKLSEFLRYQLYETNKHVVSLDSEIQFLEDFLELETIRRDDFYFSICNAVPKQTLESTLPPNLFLIFVENAVKHSADPDKASNVHLHFSNSDNLLEFKCVNTKPLTPAYSSVNGLGLANVIRRLDIIYGDRYTLKINDQADHYQIKLSIQL